MVECARREISNFDNNGRRNTKHIEGSNFLLEVDTVITAVSQYADLPFVKKSESALPPGAHSLLTIKR
jgi:NADPH-dependent glutamate synthase beta subunit-like oxidoreductase